MDITFLWQTTFFHISYTKMECVSHNMSSPICPTLNSKWTIKRADEVSFESVLVWKIKTQMV